LDGLQLLGLSLGLPPLLLLSDVLPLTLVHQLQDLVAQHAVLLL